MNHHKTAVSYHKPVDKKRLEEQKKKREEEEARNWALKM